MNIKINPPKSKKVFESELLKILAKKHVRKC